jgi:thiosulfate/3-mercaptopyruvate sulfurtransferase
MLGLPRREGNPMPFRIPVFTLALIAVFCVPASAQAPPTSASNSASNIPAAQQIQPAELSKMLTSKSGAPLVIQVGSRIFFQEDHIPGAMYAGPGSQPSGLKALETAVASAPKDKFIVLYCGCCPWSRCPNVGPAFQRLHDLGYTNVKVLYLANNFGDDWIRKGYPREH